MSFAVNHHQRKMAEDDQLFFTELGTRIATRRKEIGITQAQLAELLGISQQHMASFEKGIRKIPASMLPKLTQLLTMPLEELFGISGPATKRGPAPKLQQQMERIAQLPKPKQRFVMEMLDTVLQQAS